jgi:hypothetical protein
LPPYPPKEAQEVKQAFFLPLLFFITIRASGASLLLGRPTLLLHYG